MNKLDEDQEFISKFSKSYHSRYLFITKTLQSKLEFDELNKKDLDNFIENNINHKNFSEIMGDEFSSKLLAKNPNLTTNKALINEFNDTKNAIIFQIFFKNRVYLSFNSVFFKLPILKINGEIFIYMVSIFLFRKVQFSHLY